MWLLTAACCLQLAVTAVAAAAADVDFKYVIVGGGPGGLQMAKFLEGKGRSYVLLEKTTVASSFVKYPIHRRLISVNKMYAGEGEGREFNMRHDWNSLLWSDGNLDEAPSPEFTFRNYSSDYLPHADDLVQYLRDFSKHYKLNVRESTEVLDVYQETESDDAQKKRRFFLSTRHANGTEYLLSCEKIVWATGLKPLKMGDNTYDAKNLPTFTEYSDFSLSAASLEKFRDKHVWIIGKGNSGMEVAKTIMPYASEVHMVSRGPIRRAVETHYSGDVATTNSMAIGGYQLKSLVSFLDSGGEGGVGDEKNGAENKVWIFKNVDGKVKNSLRIFDLSQDRNMSYPLFAEIPDDNFIISCTGFKAKNDVLYRDGGRNWKYIEHDLMKHIKRRKEPPVGMKKMRLRETEKKYPTMSPWFESNEIHGLYYAGAQMHGRDWQRGNNGFIQGFRYSVRSLHHWMEQTFEHSAWPTKWGSDEPWELTGRVHQRIRTASGLYQMFGEMCDVWIFSEGGHTKTGNFREPTAVAHLTEMPCDAVPQLIEDHWRFKDSRVRFFTLSLEYGRCYKEEAVFLGTRFCDEHNFGCYSQTNMVHPVIRYYDSPSWEDLTDRSSPDFKHKATREFHLAEDLRTKWDRKYPFWQATRTFFERVDMERRGMNRKSAPVLLMERDTSQPLNMDCEFSKIGEFFYNKAFKHLKKKDKLESLEKFLLPEKFNEMYGDKIHNHAVLNEFFLAQAFKMKPDLWKKIWRGMQIQKQQENNQRLPGDENAAHRHTLHDTMYETAEKMFAFLGKKKLKKTAMTCAARTSMSVEHCLEKVVDTMKFKTAEESEHKQSTPKNQQINGFITSGKSLHLTSVHDAIFFANSTNSHHYGGARSPCFSRYSCGECQSDRCSWCFQSNSCISKEHGVCRNNITSEQVHCTPVLPEGQIDQSQIAPENFWDDHFPSKAQTYAAMIARIAVHPADHLESIQHNNNEKGLSNANFEAIMLEEVASVCNAGVASTCMGCVQNSKCAWCAQKKQCVADYAGAGGTCPNGQAAFDRIGLLSGDGTCPEIIAIFNKSATFRNGILTWSHASLTQKMLDLNLDGKVSAAVERYAYFKWMDALEESTTAPEEDEEEDDDDDDDDDDASFDAAEDIDYVIVGAGPGGLQMAQFMQMKGRSYVVLEKNSSVAASFIHFPVHRQLISTNKMHAGRAIHGDEFHMRHDWNSLLHTDKDLDEAPPSAVLFQNYSSEYMPHADTLVEYLRDFTKHYKLKVRYNSEVLGLFQKNGKQKKEGSNRIFYVNIGQPNSKSTWIRAKRVIWATGFTSYVPWDKHNAPMGRFINYADLDVGNLAQFSNKKVGILGKGNSAMEVATSILPYVASLDMFGREAPKVAYKTHYTGDVREMNEGAMGGYQLRSLVSMLDNTRAANAFRPLPRSEFESTIKANYKHPLKEELKNDATYRSRTNSTNSMFPLSQQQQNDVWRNLDYIIICTGFTSNNTILTSPENKRDSSVADRHDLVRVRLMKSQMQEKPGNEKFPEMSPWYESKSVDGLYFAGSQMHGRDYKRGNNGFIHGFRYSIRVLHRWMEQKYEHQQWPVKWGGDEPWELTGLVHQRIRTSSGLYQMFGVMCDLFVFSEGTETSRRTFSDPVGVGYQQEVPCDMVPHIIERHWRHTSASGERLRVRFLTLSFDYDRCYKNAAVFQPQRECHTSNYGCFSNSNFLHPIIRYYDSPGDEDLRMRSASDFEHKATRQFGMVEDLATKWTDKGLADLTRRFLERIAMLRNGIEAPLMLSEVDTSYGLAECDLDETGEMYLGKATKYRNLLSLDSNQYDDTGEEGPNFIKVHNQRMELNARKKFFLAQALKFKPHLWRKVYSTGAKKDTEKDFQRGYERTSGGGQQQKQKQQKQKQKQQRKSKNQNKFALNQDGSSEAGETSPKQNKEDTEESEKDRDMDTLNHWKEMVEEAQGLITEIQKKRVLHKLKLKKALHVEINSSPTVCTTPGFSVQGCLHQRSDVIDSNNVHSHGTNRMKNDTFNQGLLEPFSWLSSQAFSPNCTNSRSLTEHFNPCFTHESCHICAVADGCSWCPATTLCVSKGTCPYSENPLFQPIDFFSKKVNGSNNCEFVDKEVRLALQTTFVDFNMTRDVSYWRNRDEDIQWKKYQVGKLQRNMEFDSRIWRHPSNHQDSKLGLASYQAAFDEPLWKDLMEYTDYVTKVEKIKIGKKWLEEESNSKKSKMRAKNKCKRITSCDKCIQIPECAFCFEEGMCVVDQKNSCKSKTDHIGGEYGMKESPLPGLRRIEL